MNQLNDTAVFVQVVDSGSFTGAAEALSLSKSVISKYVSRLETRLGARLLQRSTRRLSLTEVGEVFYERCREGLRQLEDAEDAVRLLQGEPRGLLRLNMPMSFGILHVAPHLAAFRQQHPQVDIDLHLEDRMLDVIDQRFDLSIRIAALSDSRLVARRLAPCRHAVVAAPSYLHRLKSPASPAELQRHTVIGYRYQHSALQWEFESPGKSVVRVDLQPTLRVNNSLAIREAVLAGAGVARVPTFAIGDALRDGRLQVLLPEWRTLDLGVYAVYPERRHLSPKVQAFVDFLQTRIGAPPYWDLPD